MKFVALGAAFGSRFGSNLVLDVTKIVFDELSMTDVLHRESLSV